MGRSVGNNVDHKEYEWAFRQNAKIHKENLEQKKNWEAWAGDFILTEFHPVPGKHGKVLVSCVIVMTL